MGVGAVLALSVPFVAVLGWISANQFEGFFLKNWRDMMLLCEAELSKMLFIRKDIAKIWRSLF